MALTCAECRERLPEYVAGGLSSTDRQSIERHLNGCADCRREAALWREISSALADDDARIPVDPSAATSWNAIRSRIDTPARTMTQAEREMPVRSSTTNRIDAPDTGHPRDMRPDERPAPRWRPYAAIAAVLLIGLLSAALFGVMSGRGRATTVTAPKSCAPSELKATLPPHASISGISMVSAADGWAVGKIYDPQQDTIPPQTLLLRFQNCVWAPTVDAIPTAQLLKVAMVSATEGWAVGATTKRQAVSQGPNGQDIYNWEADQPFLLHYSGGQWRRVDLPGLQRIIYIPALRMVSAEEGWLLLDNGGVHTDPYTKAYSVTLLHYLHGSWTPVPLTFKEPTTILSDLVATAPDDCWIVGYGTATSDAGGLIAHYSNGNWQKWNGTIGGVQTQNFYTAAMTSPHDVWALGNPILHFDGASWAPGVEDPNKPQGLGDPMSATMISPTEGWAFSIGTLGPIPPAGLPVLHYVGGQWKAERISIASSLPISFLSNLTMATATQGWAIGSTYLSTSYAAIPRGVLLYYDSGTWTVIPGQA